MTATSKIASSRRTAGLLGITWGAVLVLRGTRLFERVEHRPPSEAERLAVLALGGRHLGQGVMGLIWPDRFGRIHASVDAIHAISMILVATTEPSRRRVALISGTLATTAAVRAWQVR